MRLARQVGAARLRRHAVAQASRAVADVVARLDASQGAPLPAPLAESLGGALGRDLRDVRIHTDRAAADAARDLGAEAFALGDDIYFAAGAYQPDRERGRHLIAHEVAHTAQQRGASGDAVEVTEAHDPSELEADRFADAFIAREREPLDSRAHASSRIVPPTSLSLVTPVRRRVIARRPDEMPDPPGTVPAPPPGSGGPATEYKDAKGVKVEVEPIDLFPNKSWAKAWDIVPRTFVPIAQGLVMVDIVPVTYGVQGEYSLGTWARGSFGPATLNGCVVYLDGETAEELGIGPSPVDQGGEGNGAASNRDKLRGYSRELWGNANMDLSASAAAGVNGSAAINAKVGVFDIFKVKGYAGLSVSGAVTANASFSPRMTMGWQDGTAKVSDLSLHVRLHGNIDVSLNAYAGVYVELSPPEIPIISDLARALNSIPIVEWAIPDPGTYTWTSDIWKKTWPVAKKSRDWNLTRVVKLAGSSPDVGTDDDFAAAATPPDFAALVKELEGEGQGEIPTDDPGPKELADRATSGAVANAHANAQGQVANTRREITREQAWNAKAAAALAERKTKAAAAGGAPPTVVLAGVGDAGDKLASRDRALRKAVDATTKIEGAAAKAAGAASGNLPQRAEAKTALDAAGANADKLGDAVTAGTGEFARPTVTADPAAEAAFNARYDALQTRLDAISDLIQKEHFWTGNQVVEIGSNKDLLSYYVLVQKHAGWINTLRAAAKEREGELDAASAEALAGEFAAANTKLDAVAQQLTWLESEAKQMIAKRPPPTWDDRYCGPENNRLMLYVEYRGIVRRKFYPSGYRDGTKPASAKPDAASKLPPLETKTVGGVEYWKWVDPTGGGRVSDLGTEWFRTTGNEMPTVDHKPAVADHWNQLGGNATTQKARADAYNGGALGLAWMPSKYNSSDGAKVDDYQPYVTTSFRGGR